MIYIRNRYLGIVTFLLYLVLGIIIGVFIYHFFKVKPIQGLDLSDLAHYITLISGIFTCISVLLLYLTLRSHTIEQLKNEFERRYYELIRFHCQNVAEMYLRDSGNTSKTICQGKEVFQKIHLQIEQAIWDIAPFFRDVEPENYYKNESVLEEDMINKHIATNNIPLNRLNQYNIGYLIVFFGLNKQGENILKDILGKKYKPDFFIPILEFCANRQTVYSKTILSFLTGKKKQYYSGHQIRLGHYFRHLFQTVVFVNETPLFTYEEKYDYIRILRTHLSPYEQSVFFFNSLSSLGRGWEIGQSIEGNCLDYQLITKYDLIRNIPYSFSQVNVRTKLFYPLVEYEWGDKVTEKRALKKHYK